MRHLLNPLDFSVEEIDQLLDLASDIEANPAKYAHREDHQPVHQVGDQAGVVAGKVEHLGVAEIGRAHV